jgi:hypothetical protein
MAVATRMVTGASRRSRSPNVSATTPTAIPKSTYVRRYACDHPDRQHHLLNAEGSCSKFCSEELPPMTPYIASR